MKRTIGLLLSIFFICANLCANWQRKVINYERNQYKGGFQNWMIDQASNGWIYCANSVGLLEFDGTNWSLYNVRNNVLRSVKVIGNRIYVGGSSEFGFFEPNDIGLLTYKSLSEKTKDWGGEVWNILADENTIYFLSDRHIHIYNKKTDAIITISASHKIDCSTLVKNILYIGTSDGIFRLDQQNTLSLLQSSEPLKGRKLVSILPYGSNKILITTAWFGLYLVENESLQKIHSIADDFIRSNQLFSTSVSGTKIALGSVQNGVFMFDPQNPLYKEAFNLENGLKNNTILNSFFDKDRNLWLGLDKGVSFIDLNAATRPLFSTVSPIGTGYCSTTYNNELYLGTNQALYKLDRDNRYQVLKGSEGQIWSLDIIDNTLFSSGDNGILVISPSSNYKIELTGVWGIRQLKADKNRIIAASYSGFSILEKRNGRWVFSHSVPDFYDSGRGFIEDESAYTFWIATPNDRVQKITFDTEFTRIAEKKLYTLPISGNCFFRKIDNRLTICSLDGIYQYSRITDSFYHYTQLESMLEGQRYYEYLDIDELKNIWFVSDGKLKFLAHTASGYKSNIYNWGLSNELIDSYENIYLMDTLSALVSVDNAFVKIDLSKPHDSRPITTHIRKLTNSKNDSIISYGNAGKAIFIPYSRNSIRIHFAAMEFTRISDVLYTYRLKGVDDEWSIPSPRPSKEYTSLPEGRYIFEVKAFIDGDENLSEPATLSFIIRPPWYRSVLAYTLYFLAIASVLLIFYKKTISKQKKIIHQKGEELIAQSRRYEEESKIKDQEIYELQNENLKTELKYKTQELNGYILNMIRKNEMLEDVKKNAVSISKAIEEEKDMTTIRQRVMRLIGQINSNIEHDNDFEVLQSNFDIIHQDFFKVLDEKFPGLSRNDKILCAYLNMNLSTKEIAPLLNISVRGVEVNRYRLRKKMNLGRDVNLSEYLRDLR